MTTIVHFVEYGSYVAACGRVKDQRHPEQWTDRCRNTTCAECWAQMS